jgi:hypothetical protein
LRFPKNGNGRVGASISLEFGCQRYRFSPDTWTLEIRSIIGKHIGRLYLDFTPSPNCVLNCPIAKRVGGNPGNRSGGGASAN